MNKDKLAFPCPEDDNYNRVDGMTLRDYFAAKTILIVMTDSYIKMTETKEGNGISEFSQFAEHAYKIADAMMEARDK